ncbi:MAG: ATP-binding protein, partial [Myxococcota bacterium]
MSERKNKYQKRIDTFRATVAERIVQMNVAWIQLEQGVGQDDVGQSLLGELHTLKGEAGMLGFSSVAELAHALEDLVGSVVSADSPPPVEIGDFVLRAFDLITSLSERDPGDAVVEVADFLSSIASISENPILAANAPSSALTHTHSGVTDPVGQDEDGPADDIGSGLGRPESPTKVPSEAVVAPPKPPAPAPPAPVLSASADAELVTPTQDTPDRGDNRRPNQAQGERARSATTFAVRVNPRHLDRIRDIIGELLLTRTRLSRIATALHHERYGGSAPVLELMLGSDSAPRRDDVLRSVEAQLRDDVLRMSNLVSNLDDVTRDLRMVSISVLFDRYPLAVRTIGRKLNRQVQLVCSGESVLADRDVLEALEDPLLHLVRNAVDHGIEPPADRRRQGKAPTGTVILHAGVIGDNLYVEVSDDGAGIDVEKVRKLAIKRGIVDANAARSMSAQAVLQCLFAPGMSTRTSITRVSGRGIGLDVVQKIVRNLGGSVELKSTPNVGSTFRIEVPIHASITSVLLFRVGRGWYALPSSTLVAIEEIDDYPIAASIDGPSLHYKDSLLPLVSLEQVLGESHRDSQHGRRRTRVVIVRHGSLVMGLTGSYSHLQREAVLKSVSALFRDDKLITAGLA